MIRGTGIDSTVKLYLKGNGANGSTKFFDDSQSHKSITANGNAKISNAIPPMFGTGSIYFDGDGDYLSFRYDIPKSGDFNVGVWVYPTDVSSYKRILSLGSEDTPEYNAISIFIQDATHVGVLFSEGLNVWKNGASYSQLHSTDINVWSYFNVIRSGSNISLYINSILIHTWTGVGTLYDYGDLCNIGYNNQTVPAYFTGYIDDFIISEKTTDGTKIPTRQRG